MNIESLDRYGVPDQVIKRWRLDGIRFLLPIQSESVARFGLLDGQSLIISGPGTSGKTFCGELAALAKIANRQKAIFMEPFKAIAEEKFNLFQKRYSALGIRIRLATRDHCDDDGAYARGNFDIALFIYEKLNCLTATDITLIKSASCFVLDEFQMISDRKRGLELELAILKIKAFNPGAQVVILMGGGSSAERISRWLNFRVLEENRRPVDLRLGVLHRGTFHFRGYNDLNEGDEYWLQQIDSGDDGPLTAQNLAAIEHLASKEEQILIFTRSRKTAEGLAEHLSIRLNLPSARKSLAALTMAPPSIQNEKLQRCLSKGVAFHHAELDENQRQLVENGFRSGEIKILSSTTTLAWGVNLPARNVFIETLKYSGTKTPNSHEQMVPLTGIDFHQAAGRAGRLGSRQAFGRAIMTAATPYEQEVLWGKYVYGLNEDPPAGLAPDQLPELILRLVACGAATRPDEIEKSCRGTYASACGALGDDLSHRINNALLCLEKGDIVSIKAWGKIEPTALGSAASVAGLSAESTIRIGEVFSDGKTYDPLEWLFLTLHLSEWTQDASGYHARSDNSHVLSSLLSAKLGDGHLDSYPVISNALQNLRDASNRQALTAFLFATDWISGTPTRDLEMAYNKGAGGLKRDALVLAWIITGIERIGRAITPASGPNAKLFSSLCLLVDKLRFGVDDRMLPLARALHIDREFIRRLYESGFTTLDHLWAIDFGALLQIIPAPAVARIQKWRERQAKSIKSHDLIDGLTESKRGICSPPPSNEQMPAPASGPEFSIIFTGNHRKLNSEIVISDHSVFLQPRLYSYLQKLWWAAAEKRQWVHRDSLDAGPHQAKYISKLRRILKNNITGIEIISNGRGSYRLMFPGRSCQADS